MIATQTVGTDQIIRVGSAALVSSKSAPGTWHQVTVDTTGRPVCDCRGFEFRQKCRHLTAIVELDRAAAEAKVEAWRITRRAEIALMVKASGLYD